MYTSMCGSVWSQGSHSEVFGGLSCCMSEELTNPASSQGLLTFDPSVKPKTDASELTHIRPLNKLVRNFFHHLQTAIFVTLCVAVFSSGSFLLTFILKLFPLVLSPSSFIPPDSQVFHVS